MPTKLELEREVSCLRAKLEDARDIIDEALGVVEEDDCDDCEEEQDDDLL